MVVRLIASIVLAGFLSSCGLLRLDSAVNAGISNCAWVQPIRFTKATKALLLDRLDDDDVRQDVEKIARHNMAHEEFCGHGVTGGKGQGG